MGECDRERDITWVGERERNIRGMCGGLRAHLRGLESDGLRQMIIVDGLKLRLRLLRLLRNGLRGMIIGGVQLRLGLQGLLYDGL